jgi:uncharacterized protein (TIGR00251 family)
LIQFSEKNDCLYFNVKVVPRASKSEIAGELGGALKVRIAAPPVDGAANAELIKLLSKTFDVSKAQVEIVVGETSKNKQIKISNLNAQKFLQILNLK